MSPYFTQFIQSKVSTIIKKTITIKEDSIALKIIDPYHQDIINQLKNYDIVADIKVSDNIMKFFPNQIKLSEIILSSYHSKKPLKSNNVVLIQFEMPSPGLPLQEIHLRSIYNAQYIKNIKSQTFKVETCCYFWMWGSETGVLLYALEKELDQNELNPNTCLTYLEQLYKKYSVEEDIDVKAVEVLSRLHDNDAGLIELWNLVCQAWKLSYQQIFDQENIQLCLDFQNDINNKHLFPKSLISKLTVSKQCLWTKVGSLYLNYLSFQKYHHIIKIFNHKNTFHQKEALKLFGDSFKVDLIPLHDCTGLGEGPISNWIKNAKILVAKESNVELDGINDQVTCKLSISFFITQLLQMKKTNACVFINGRLKNQESSVGMYIQYAYARLCGIKRYIQSETNIKFEDCLNSLNSDFLQPFMSTPKIFQLIHMIEQYPTVITKAEYEPSVLIAFLLKFSTCISSLYYHLRIKGEDLAVQKARWLVLATSLDLLENGILTLGFDPIDEI
ncbi:hypothetical protein BC833DRAFT_586481 [Globomyces pollinis-pini]|nr:hypothetical protein BC833DRAFT_586481 [Globomyces pollinis-pini]